MSNAVKFTDTGSVTLHIGVAPPDRIFGVPTLDGAARVIAFQVKDTGIGISDEKLRLIFEAFQQADGTTSRKYGGTGLGLSISRALARLLGGAIEVASRVGVGSTFTLYLPDALLADTIPTAMLHLAGMPIAAAPAVDRPAGAADDPPGGDPGAAGHRGRPATRRGHGTDRRRRRA